MTQRGTCLRHHVANSHFKRKRLTGLLRRIFFLWHRVVFAHGQQHQNLHSSWPARANSQGEAKKKTIYTLSNKNTLWKPSGKERNKIVISHWAAILCHLRIGLITLLNEQNGLLSYSGNKHPLQWPATAQNVSLSDCSYGSRPYTPFLSFSY